MVTEVFTRKYCDQHAVRDEKVEATEVIQFAWEGQVREIDACDECKKEHETRFEPLVDYSRPVKKRRAAKKAEPAKTPSAEAADASADGASDEESAEA
ncbi:Lsr2 family protein [Nocardiopsis chromatogenes]|uniref:Lsr2 family protein n=1 Tax=Nocardiopsis chromatogenes TaxID=280239 RepID=UPI00034C5033|nr:Lsr2 family protein [Nocardiopsis chromatogenes]